MHHVGNDHFAELAPFPVLKIERCSLSILVPLPTVLYSSSQVDSDSAHACQCHQPGAGSTDGKDSRSRGTQRPSPCCPGPQCAARGSATWEPSAPSRCRLLAPPSATRLLGRRAAGRARQKAGGTQEGLGDCRLFLTGSGVSFIVTQSFQAQAESQQKAGCQIAPGPVPASLHCLRRTLTSFSR